jgi:hypothetical protein
VSGFHVVFCLWLVQMFAADLKHWFLPMVSLARLLARGVSAWEREAGGILLVTQTHVCVTWLLLVIARENRYECLCTRTQCKAGTSAHLRFVDGKRIDQFIAIFRWFHDAEILTPGTCDELINCEGKETTLLFFSKKMQREFMICILAANARYSWCCWSMAEHLRAHYLLFSPFFNEWSQTIDKGGGSVAAWLPGESLRPVLRDGRHGQTQTQTQT